eukprot:gnl/TRDRNA2_/TRDRNA2_72666_c1_seq1.p1 gnl/TRDRNA2_/TRDRNA2_72666_c1~~gnl/TRDRNA2_/TRDRNA2_72666_c1_seq1.p1  ORF type:complete len:416 (+),score=49.52 gnl/TRDRNA2_/TRDRNA2_72666_c1_seq1:186-1250(+)
MRRAVAAEAGLKISTIDLMFRAKVLCDFVSVNHAGLCEGDTVHIVDSTAVLATACDDGIARIWRISDGACICSLRGHTKAVSCVALSPHDRRVATASEDGTARLWGLQDGICSKVLTGHSSAVHSVAFSLDPRLVATASADHTVRVWHFLAGKTLQTLQGHTDEVRDIAFSSDGRLLASASDDGTARVWRAEIGGTHQDWRQVQCVWKFQLTAVAIVSLSFSPDSALLAAASRAGEINVLSVEDGSCIATCGGPEVAPLTSVAFGPDGSALLAARGGTPGYIGAKIWRLPKGISVMSIDGRHGPAASAAFSPDGSLVAIASAGGTASIWRVEDGACMHELTDHGGRVTSVVFSP